MVELWFLLGGGGYIGLVANEHISHPTMIKANSYEFVGNFISNVHDYIILRYLKLIPLSNELKIETPYYILYEAFLLG